MVLARRARGAAIATLSLALHGVVLLWLAWPRSADLVANRPDLSSMTVEMTRPPSAARASPRRTPARAAAAPAPIVAPSSTAIPKATEASVPPAPEVAAPPDPARLRAALRAGVGCARVASRSREEREACEERLGAVAADGPRYAAPMDPEKRAYYDELAAAGPSSRSQASARAGGASPGALQVLKCSVTFGAGAKEKDRQGMVRLGKTPCYIPLQGSFFTPEAGVHKR